MANLIQAIIVREDLNLPRGLLTAQVAHIHMESIRQLLLDEKKLSLDQNTWLKTPYIHVHGVPNKEWYDYFIEKSKKATDYTFEWKDTICLSLDGKSRTAFPNVQVGFSIGPCDADKIKTIIGELPFLN